MEFGLTMPTHGLLRRDERDFYLQNVPAAEMRPIEVAQLAERLGYHSVDFHGCFYEIKDVSLEPKPVQKPYPPLVFGAVTEVGARRAARTSDGIYPMFLDSFGDPGRFEHLREAVLRESERIGRDVAAFRMYAFCSGLVVGPGDELALREPRMTLTGTADQVLGDIARFGAAGYSHLTMHFDVRSGAMSEYLEIVARFAEEVIPAASAITARPFI